jgi:hypothetical protein
MILASSFGSLQRASTAASQVTRQLAFLGNTLVSQLAIESELL